MTISPRDRALLAVVAVIAVFAGFYLLALKPQTDRADQLGRSVAAAQKQLATARGEYATGRLAEHRLTQTEAEFAAANRAVPGSPNIPALLRLLQREADAAHVSIQSISLNGSSSGASAPAAPATTTATTPTTGTTGTSGTTAAAAPETVPVSLTFTGGYQALNRMVRQLDGLVEISHGHLRSTGPLVGISTVALTPGQGGGLSVALSATIYQSAASTAAGSEGTS